LTVFISRRELLKRASLVGAAALVPADALASADATPAAGQVLPPVRAAAREALEHLTATESAILEAVAARVIPTDANGPGAAEARAAHYIDHALGSALASSREAYAAGLAALDRHARSIHNRPFIELSVAEQDAILMSVESGGVPGFAESPAFFSMVRAHVIQGTFCDPYYGGNANFVGWDLIGYPGVRTIAGPDEQRLGGVVTPNHKSAYDYEMFTKAAANAAPLHGSKHGD
jgi:gluconate 2-dehydrogenase gamma chain